MVAHDIKRCAKKKKSHLLIIINCVLITSKFCQIFQHVEEVEQVKDENER